MDIIEIRSKKAKLEQEIANKIIEFEKNTTVRIAGIEIAESNPMRIEAQMLRVYIDLKI